MQRALKDARFTPAAMAIYLSVFEGRDWDREWNWLDGRRGVYADPINRTIGRRVEWC
jgi:hypothetical protein